MMNGAIDLFSSEMNYVCWHAISLFFLSSTKFGKQLSFYTQFGEKVIIQC
jgi:hypothetical protein